MATSPWPDAVPTRSPGIPLVLLALWASLAGADAGEKVVIITPHVDPIRIEFGNGFSRWHQERFNEPGDVEWRSVGGTQDALRFIQSEFQTKPDGIGLDILFGGGQEPYLVLADQDLALSYRPAAEVLDGIPPSLMGMEIYDP